MLAEGDTEGDELLDGLTLALGETDGETLLLGEGLADGLSEIDDEGLALSDGDLDADPPAHCSRGSVTVIVPILMRSSPPPVGVPLT